LFTSLIALTFVQALGAAVLVYARADEMEQRVRSVDAKAGNVIVCATRSQCVDLAELWNGREFFAAGTPRELKQFLIEMRAQNVDTVWLHLDAYDSLYIKTFPETKPVWPYRMTVIQSGHLYKTWWRIYELVINRNDKTWGSVLEDEAGYSAGEERFQDALTLQKEVVQLWPDSAKSHSNLAVLYAQLNRRDDAIASAQTAIELNPALTEPRRLLEALTDSSAKVP
jgi:tetratricopeptide (TPR) repeat protein